MSLYQQRQLLKQEKFLTCTQPLCVGGHNAVTQGAKYTTEEVLKPIFTSRISTSHNISLISYLNLSVCFISGF
jgi:hypothetical protein